MVKTCENQQFTDNPGYGKPWCLMGGTCWYAHGNANKCPYYKEPLKKTESDDDGSGINYAFKRDLERVIMKTNENILDAYCDTSCGKRLNYDGNGNLCPRNCCTRFVNFVNRVKMKPIRNLETQEAKAVVAKHANLDPKNDF